MTVKLEQIAGINRHETAFLYDEIFVRRCYLPPGLELPEHAVAFDVGANIGMYALFVTSVCPTARVFAFEPLPPIVAKLRENAAGRPGVSVFPFGLSDRDCRTKFTYYPGYTTMSVQREYTATELEKAYVKRLVSVDDEIADQIDELLDFRFEETVYECEVRTLSRVIAEESVDRIDVLKIDVQRAELDVLRGIADQHWPIVRQVLVEVHDEPGTGTEGRLARIVDLLDSHGFAVTVAGDRQAATDSQATAERHAVHAIRR